MDTIRIKRGLKADLPVELALGELAYCVDTNELYVGQGYGEGKSPKYINENINNLIQFNINLIKDTCNIKLYPRLEGETDDTGRIERCLRDNNKVYLPYRDTPYKISGNGISLGRDMSIIGDENNRTLIEYSGSTHCFYFDVGLDIWNWDSMCTNLVIRDISIKCLNNSSDGLYLNKVFRSGIFNVKISGSNRGIYMPCGWTNNFCRLELIENIIGIKFGSNLYNSSKFKSFIVNAINLIGSRIEYNNINIQLGDSRFDSDTIGISVNVDKNTIQFARDYELDLTCFKNINITSNYFECNNSKEKALIRVGNLDSSVDSLISYPNKYLITSGVVIRGNTFVGSLDQGDLKCIELNHFTEISVEDNIFMNWKTYLEDRFLGDKIIIDNKTDQIVNISNNTYVNSNKNTKGKYQSTDYEVYKGDEVPLLNGWYGFSSSILESFRVVYHNGQVYFDGSICSDNFQDNDVMFKLPEHLRPNAQLRFSVRSLQSGKFKASNCVVVITVDGNVMLVSETEPISSTAVTLSNIRYTLA